MFMKLNWTVVKNLSADTQSFVHGLYNKNITTRLNNEIVYICDFKLDKFEIYYCFKNKL